MLSVSARRLLLSEEDLRILFGKGLFFSGGWLWTLWRHWSLLAKWFMLFDADLAKTEVFRFLCLLLLRDQLWISLLFQIITVSYKKTLITSHHRTFWAINVKKKRYTINVASVSSVTSDTQWNASVSADRVSGENPGYAEVTVVIQGKTCLKLSSL